MLCVSQRVSVGCDVVQLHKRAIIFILCTDETRTLEKFFIGWWRVVFRLAIIGKSGLSLNLSASEGMISVYMQLVDDDVRAMDKTVNRRCGNVLAKTLNKCKDHGIN